MPKDLVTVRSEGNDAALFLIHGFTGTASDTWGGFLELLPGDPELANYDIFSWGYPSKLDLAYTITRYFWTEDPSIATIGQGLRTLLSNFAQGYKKLILVGHSMGGLVIQSFILEELARKNRQHLDRLTEVLLYGTPSGGLIKASLVSFLKDQIDDMRHYGPFIQNLRADWHDLVDERKAASDPGFCFRLTLVAGMQDRFVPLESSLNPFPLDEKEIVPGDHTSMVKPTSPHDLAYCVLKKRMLRGAPTAQESALILGHDRLVIERINRIKAAVELGDIYDLNALAEEALEAGAPCMPLADRALGLALSDHEQYEKAAHLLQRYLDFEMPFDRSRPFHSDAQVVQQLAIALSGAGNITAALSRLNDLDPQVQDQSETVGIRAGRIKRQWLKNPQMVMVGQRALNTYKAAFELAKAAEDLDQQIFNGINYAYMSFALGRDYEGSAREIAALCQTGEGAGYWWDATHGEALLLLRRYAEAGAAYEKAFCRGPAPRHVSTTICQAREIMRRQGNPPEARPVAEMMERCAPFAGQEGGLAD